MNKKVTAIGLSAGLLAGLGAGLVLEMSGSAGAAGSPAAITAVTDTTVAATDDTSTDAATVDADRTARLQEVLQPLIDDGILTQAQADQVIAALEAAGPMHGPGKGGMGRGMFGGLDSVATLLGLTADELAAELEGGATLAEVAVANGSTAQAVIDVLVQQVEDHFAEEVAAGEHTQEEADARIAEATTRITDMVNNGGGMRGPGMGHHGGRGHGHGDMDGDTDGSTDGSGGTIDGGPSDGTDDATSTSAEA